MRLEVTKRFDFHAAHRLGANYPGDCRNLHGHTYAVEVTIVGDSSRLDEHGMVVEFGKVKDLCYTQFVKANLDHAFIAAECDPLIEVLKAADQKVYILPPGATSTAENMAVLLAREFMVRLADAGLIGERGVYLERVRFFETPTSWVDAKPGK